MVEQSIERYFQVAARGAAGRNHHAIDDGLLCGRVVGLQGQHLCSDIGVVAVIARSRRVEAIPGFRGGVAVGVSPTGQHLRHAADVFLAIGRDGLAKAIEHACAIGVELPQPDAEKLHHFARVVFIRQASGRQVFLLVADVRQPIAHRRRQRHFFQQRAVVAEGIGSQQVVVGRVADGIDVAHHEDLAEPPGNPLPQLVRAGDRLLPERFDGVLVGEVVDVHALRLQAEHVRVVRGARQRELVVDPVAVAARGQRHRLDFGRAERGLVEEARRFADGDAGLDRLARVAPVGRYLAGRGGRGRRASPLGGFDDSFVVRCQRGQRHQAQGKHPGSGGSHGGSLRAG